MVDIIKATKRPGQTSGKRRVTAKVKEVESDPGPGILSLALSFVSTVGMFLLPIFGWLIVNDDLSFGKLRAETKRLTSLSCYCAAALWAITFVFVMPRQLCLRRKRRKRRQRLAAPFVVRSRDEPSVLSQNRGQR